MLLLLFLFGLALGAAPPSEDPDFKLQRGGCPLFWYSFNGRCYKYVATSMTWADAELHCVSIRANLVSIHSLAEQDFVKTLIRNFDPGLKHTWIGLSDVHKEGSWMWSDGSAVNTTIWLPGQPDNYQGNEDCTEIWGPDFRWNDILCTMTKPFVCAFS
ncbi:ladderlectin-like [Cheilinus undulatus]|uniref:ladderlectin-like n=1 Tax=Cheilinus undulatus TaxID=241271 RepID=UPI001BD2FCFE|nr:ladderlectin-like [Cheilinus undulatus]